jgi:hypothetical protein
MWSVLIFSNQNFECNPFLHHACYMSSLTYLPRHSLTILGNKVRTGITANYEPWPSSENEDPTFLTFRWKRVISFTVLPQRKEPPVPTG